MKFAYCPEWYSIKVIKRWKMVYKISLIVFLTVISIMIVYVNIQYSKLSIAEEKVKARNMAAIAENEKADNENDDNLNFFYEFCDLANKNGICLKSASMEDKIISADICLNQRDDYSEIIRNIEDKYMVIETSPIEERDGSLFFKVKVDNNVQK